MMTTTEITKLNNYKPTTAEIKILEVLTEPDNLTKSITEKAELAGVSRVTWYKAFSKSGFVSLISDTAIGLIRGRAIELVNASFREAKRGSFADRKMLLEVAQIYQGVPTHQTNIQVNVKPIYGGKSIEGTGDVTQDNDRVRAITITSKPLNQSSDTTASIDVKDSVDSTQENE